MLRLLPAIFGFIMLTVAANTGAAQESAPAEMRMMGQCAGCVLNGNDYREGRLTGVELADSKITEVSFNEATLSLAIFDGARLTNVNFDGANLRGASFVGAVLVNVTFDGADLMGAVFEGATLDQTDLSTARLCKTQLPDDMMANDGCN